MLHWSGWQKEPSELRLVGDFRHARHISASIMRVDGRRLDDANGDIYIIAGAPDIRAEGVSNVRFPPSQWTAVTAEI